jgi:hypothetical protein
LKGELPLSPVDLLFMARKFLERFSETETNVNIPLQLIDGLSLYENDLRKQVESNLPPRFCFLKSELDKDVDNLKSRIKQQFTDRRKYGYRLHSVFIHRGMYTIFTGLIA